MLISVIIPVYNVENYIKKGVESVINQSYTNFELLLVNDGSKDNSPKICDDFASKDSRVKVLHKINGGASDARNQGILAAKGDYLMFLDSDDYWDDNNAIQKVVNRLTESKDVDILLFYWKNINLNTNRTEISNKKYQTEIFKNATKPEVLKNLFDTGLFPSSAVITVVNRAFILQNELFFVKGIKAEDVDWTLNVFKHANKVDAINEDFYVVLLNREGSVTSTADVKSIESILFILDKWCPEFITKNDPLSHLFLGHLSFHYSTCFVIYPNLSNTEKKFVKNRLETYKFLFKHIQSKKAFLVKFIITIFGIEIGTRLIGMFFKIRKKTR